MKSRISNTQKRNVENEKGLNTSDISAIIIFSIICVSSFLFSIFFLIISVFIKNSKYLIGVFVYLLIAIISFLYLFKFSNKDKNEQATSRTRIAFPWL